IDIEASYGSGYNTPTTTADVLWLNNKNSNHFITFNLTGTASNQNAIGAKVTITGAFGTQVREVRSGETYGTSNSLQVHFGLGSNTEITSAVIEWPAGGTTTFGTLSANQFVTAVEGTCTITGNIIPGPFAYCTGGSVTLNAQPGYTSYLWSNGATTSAVTSTSTSNYNVLVSAAGCSNLSPTITTVLNPIETPTVTTSGVNSCAGTLTLTSSTAAAYNWTGPAGFTATTQSINPTTTGTYSLTTTGLCQNWTAAPTVISVLASPSPTATGVSGPGPATYNLSAAGSGTVNWYATASGGVSLGTGVAFTTPTISTTTTYYIDQTTNYPGATNSTGKANGSGSAASTLNGGLDFNVIAPCTLTSVKVYATTSGTKTIQLKNSAGTVLNSYTTGILPVDSSVITLNFPLIPGTGYRLTQSSATTTQLKRNNTGATYPYSAAGYVTITNGYTGTTTSSAQYYYYYDWKITAPTLSCTSTPRVPVVATVTPSVSATSTLGSQILCNGGTTTVTVAGSGGTPPYTGEGVFTVGAGIHNFTVTDATSATFVTTITVTEPALLISNYVSTDPTTCSGANGAIDLTITGGTSAYTFLWSNGASTQNISGLAAGVYSYTVTDANGCTSNASSTLSNPPAPSVTVAIPVDTACTYNAAFVLTGGSPIGGIFTGAGVTLGSFNPSAASAGFNVITYTYTDSNGCFAASTDNIFVDVCAGISSISEPLFNIYPNPTSGMLNIETEANENTISLFDVLGNVIYSVKSSSLKTEIDMQNFADGIYFLKVANSKTVSTMRIIRSK
ncbi:MAG: ASPIC/UnbV domain-containing protein, partial [Bacteroidetes bacterium]|nr:ASPIC/UnbV domain-containing protein [Bacteroidota bacterium]